MKRKHYVYLFSTFLLITITSFVITLVASGFRIGNDGTITQTGIISINSAPDGALVYINDVPKDATNTNITQLKPGTYSVRLEKEGFVTWREDIKVVKQTVTRADALLIPLYPSFSPLTFTGVINPVLSPDGQKIIFQSIEPNNAGVWLLDLTDRPFNLSSKPRQLLVDTENLTYSTMSIVWSPTSDEIQLSSPNVIMREGAIPNIYYYSLSSNHMLDPTPTGIPEEWAQTIADEQDAILKTLPEEDQIKITSFAIHSWSPDKSRILYTTTQGDSTEYNIYEVPGIHTNTQPSPTPPSHKTITNPILTVDSNYTISWFSDSKHLLVVHQNDEASGVVEIVEVNGHNRTQIFNGSLSQKTVFPSPSGTKIIILSRFNNETDGYNLYTLNLR
ncbi:hypothetical protein COY32_01780 [candidate division WWE3 bacterium CG_4_10_14_0_2_um_filter_41_14]|uniref:PEGA domain-containing protein n=1 Tax=candidate division WWE3 bacterium CG_4_10_14_0_2_um_filter_41_14 TaxID=1975072 RepID=A0A2M7TKJ9_UNCKA|nr:MAG: hypothetical protein COY32_01780 [candidate division WWE3 bacterium CG_4_10_14_0_2_um_filter_41_14]